MGEEPNDSGEIAGDADLPPGTRAGEYVIEARVGRGGMGSVYAATHPVLGRRAAIKVMAADLRRDPAFVRRFVEEARAVHRVKHPNLVESFSFGQLEDGRCYYAMEWLDGETLSARLRRGPVPLDEMLAVLDGVADALEAIHAAALVHRDLTPGNLFLLRARDGRLAVKVVDFGVAKQLGAGDLRLTASGMTLGTPTYAAPEQLAGGEVDGRADIYSLGVIGYQMATGEVPFDEARATALTERKVSETAPTIAGKGLPAGFERLIAAMLERDPGRRPHLAAIRAALRDLSIGRPRGRARAFALAAALLATAALLAVALASGDEREAPTAPPPSPMPAAAPIADAAAPIIDAAAAPVPPDAAPTPPRPRRAGKRAKRPAAPEPVPDDPDYLLEPRKR